MDYNGFLKGKQTTDVPTGFIEDIDLNPILFDFQRDINLWALKRGRAAIWADCGLGKSFMQIEWAKNVPGNVLILAPLAVANQTVREGKKLGVKIKYCRNQDEVDIQSDITIANYEMLEHFDPSYFNGIVLDESSILKNYSGKIRNQIIETFKNTPFRLACTATPAPNDYMEIGNHAEFLGVMTRTQMLSMFFVHDGGDTSKWRLKGHAESDFWKWLCSWAVMIRKPSELGYSDQGFNLPELKIQQHTVESGITLPGQLFVMHAQTLQERQQARRVTITARVNSCAELAKDSTEPWLIWCNQNAEQSQLEKAFGDRAISIFGSLSMEEKEKRLLRWLDGERPVLISKPSIIGLGINMQHCNNMAFVGLSDSYEQYYQAVRRCWRFGQKKTVNVYVITADIEGAVVKNIQRKEADAIRMAENMVEHMHVINETNIKGMARETIEYKPVEKMGLPTWM